MKHLLILDNKGKTFDRYTIVDKRDGEMIGASENPFHPQGFGQYCGNVADNHWVDKLGYNWRQSASDKIALNRRIKTAMKQFEKDCADVGKPITWDQLPADVQKFAKQSFDLP